MCRLMSADMLHKHTESLKTSAFFETKSRLITQICTKGGKIDESLATTVSWIR